MISIREIAFVLALSSVSCWGLACLSLHRVERQFFALCGLTLAGILCWVLALTGGVDR